MSTHLRIPLMYHPTNVALLDDDRRFLNDLSLALDESIPYVLDDDPDKILSYLESHSYGRDSLSSLLTKPVFDVSSESKNSDETFSIHFSHLLKMLTSPDRFKICSTGLIDRLMKKIDGLDFCRKIHDLKLPMRLVLLTGETGNDEAVEAFNKKLIDAYLVKGNNARDLAELVNSTIKKCSKEQFLDLSESVSGLLSHVLEPLYDEQFAVVFDEACERHQAVEFYLLDSSCSFLLLDKLGQATQLFVRNEADFNDCYEIARDSQAPYEVLQSLRSRQKFPYTREPMGYAKVSGDSWEDIMIPMEKVPGRDIFFAEMERRDIESTSFNQYLQREWPKP